MKDFISKLNKFMESFSQRGCCRSLCLNAKDEIPAVKMPFAQIVFRPFGIFASKLKELFRLSALFALLFAALATFMGFNNVCFVGYSKNFFFCSDSDAWYLFYIVLKLFLLAVFGVRWFNIAFLQTSYNWKNIFLPTAKDFQTAGILSIFLIVNLIPVLSFYMLYIRVPNPNWVIEIIYFAIVSLGFFVPFVVMRFYSMFAIFLSGQKLPPIHEVWAKSKGNNMRIILSLFLIMIVVFFIVINFQRNFRVLEVEYINYVGIVSEYLYDVAFLMLITLFINNCFVQKELLYGDKTDGSTTAN